MRINDAPGGVPAVDQTSEAAGAEGVGQVEGALAAVEVTPVDGVTADLVTRVAQGLQSGRYTAREAVEILIDDAVQRQVGEAVGNRAALAGKLKDVLRRFAETDPYLSGKVRRLGSRTVEKKPEK